MGRVVVFWLMFFLFTTEVFAQPALSSNLFLTDLLDIKGNRYFEGCSYSRFPRSEKKLHIPFYLGQDLLDSIYAQARARIYSVQPGDTFKKISLRYGTTTELIKAVNRIKGDRLRIGQRLFIPDQAFTIEINKTLNCLYLKTGDVLIKAYPVSTGKSAEQTPVGVFLIQSRYPYPTWFHKGVVVPAASPDNYLGSRWLGFDKPQYGIHGTIFPELIGQSVSKGCIRMKNEDVEELYEFIPIGTVVIITEI